MLIFGILPWWGDFRKWQVRLGPILSADAVLPCGLAPKLPWAPSPACLSALSLLHNSTAPHAAPPTPRWCLQVYRRALPGLNSAAVGLIVTSVFQLTLNAYTTSPFPHASICIGILGYAATDVLGVAAPFVVVGGGALGVIAHYTHMN